MHCTNPGLSSFLLAPPGVSTRDPSSERRNYLGEKFRPKAATSTTWDKRLYFPSEGRRAENFFRLENPRVWVPKASRLPLDHRSRLSWWWGKCKSHRPGRIVVLLRASCFSYFRVVLDMATTGSRYNPSALNLSTRGKWHVLWWSLHFWDEQYIIRTFSPEKRDTTDSVDVRAILSVEDCTSNSSTTMTVNNRTVVVRKKPGAVAAG